MAQAVHAAFQFSQEHSDLVAAWHLKSNYLVIVAADEQVIYDLVARARDRGIVVCCVREPDLDNEITAIVLEPGSVARTLCANLPLALKGS